MIGVYYNYISGNAVDCDNREYNIWTTLMLAGVTQSECCTCTDIPSQSKRTFCLEGAQQKVNTNVEVIKRWTRCVIWLFVICPKTHSPFPTSNVHSCQIVSVSTPVHGLVLHSFKRDGVKAGNMFDIYCFLVEQVEDRTPISRQK